MSCDFSREPSVGLPSRSLGEFKSEGSRCWRIPQSGLQSRRESQADNTQTRADGSWDRQGGTNSSWCHLSRCPLTAPSAVTTSAWARPLGGDEPGPPPLSCCSRSRGLHRGRSSASSSSQKHARCPCSAFLPRNTFSLSALCSLLLRLGCLQNSWMA